MLRCATHLRKAKSLLNMYSN